MQGRTIPVLVEDQLEFVIVEGILRNAILIVTRVVKRRRKDWIDSDSTYQNTYLKAFSTMLGINLSRTGQSISRQGFVLISMSHGLNLASIIKSSPKISKLLPFLSGSMKQKDDLTASVATALILG